MEVIGGVSAVATLASEGFKLYRALEKFIAQVKDADQEALRLVQQTRGTHAILNQFAVNLKQEEELALCNPDFYHSANRYMASCRALFIEVEDCMSASISGLHWDQPWDQLDIVLSRNESFKWPFSRKHALSLFDSLHDITQDISLMITTINESHNLDRRKKESEQQARDDLQKKANRELADRKFRAEKVQIKLQKAMLNQKAELASIMHKAHGGGGVLDVELSQMELVQELLPAESVLANGSIVNNRVGPRIHDEHVLSHQAQARENIGRPSHDVNPDAVVPEPATHQMHAGPKPAGLNSNGLQASDRRQKAQETAFVAIEKSKAVTPLTSDLRPAGRVESTGSSSSFRKTRPGWHQQWQLSRIGRRFGISSPHLAIKDKPDKPLNHEARSWVLGADTNWEDGPLLLTHMEMRRIGQDFIAKGKSITDHFSRLPRALQTSIHAYMKSIEEARFESWTLTALLISPKRARDDKVQGATAIITNQLGTEDRAGRLLCRDVDERQDLFFKDALSRDYNLPISAVLHWQDMQNIIKQAFEHISLLAEEVAQAQYYLKDAEGKIILPSLWRYSIRPGRVITMHMWPGVDQKLHKLAMDVSGGDAPEQEEESLDQLGVVQPHLTTSRPQPTTSDSRVAVRDEKSFARTHTATKSVSDDASSAETWDDDDDEDSGVPVGLSAESEGSESSASTPLRPHVASGSSPMRRTHNRARREGSHSRVYAASRDHRRPGNIPKLVNGPWDQTYYQSPAHEGEESRGRPPVSDHHPPPRRSRGGWQYIPATKSQPPETDYYHPPTQPEGGRPPDSDYYHPPLHPGGSWPLASDYYHPPYHPGGGWQFVPAMQPQSPSDEPSVGWQSHSAYGPHQGSMPPQMPPYRPTPYPQYSAHAQPSYYTTAYSYHQPYPEQFPSSYWPPPGFYQHYPPPHHPPYPHYVPQDSGLFESPPMPSNYDASHETSQSVDPHHFRSDSPDSIAPSLHEPSAYAKALVPYWARYPPAKRVSMATPSNIRANQYASRVDPEPRVPAPLARATVQYQPWNALGTQSTDARWKEQTQAKEAAAAESAKRRKIIELIEQAKQNHFKPQAKSVVVPKPEREQHLKPDDPLPGLLKRYTNLGDHDANDRNHQREEERHRRSDSFWPRANQQVFYLRLGAEGHIQAAERHQNTRRARFEDTSASPMHSSISSAALESGSEIHAPPAPSPPRRGSVRSGPTVASEDDPSEIYF